MMGALPEQFGSGGVVQTADPIYTGGESLYSPAPTGDFAPPPADAENKPEDSPVDGGQGESPTGEGTDQKEDTPKDDENGDEGNGTKFSPLVLLGGAALIYFLFFRKKS